MTGTGTLLDPYIIGDVTDLQNIDNDRDAYYELGVDIDALTTVSWNGGSGFKPISHLDQMDWHNNIYFSGHLDGKGHTITGLTVNRPLGSDPYAMGGLFACMNGATVHNLEMIDPVITVYDWCGAITGCDYGGCIYDNIIITNPHMHSVRGNGGCLLGLEYTGTYWSLIISAHSDIHDCHVVGGSITANVGASIPDIGGLAGWWNEGEVSDSDSSADVIVLDDAGAVAGGLVGWVGVSDLGYGGSYVHDCFSTGDVIGLLEEYGLYGGFVGWIDGGTFERCYATGDVNAPFSIESGGFTSWIKDATLSDCYCTGDVYGASELGGFVYYIESHGLLVSLDRCYATGDIYVANIPWFGSSYIGGFVGDNAAGSIQECFCTGDIFIDNAGDADLAEIAGFAGDNWYSFVISPAIIRNCYSRTNIYVTAGSTVGGYVGGFCGYHDPDGDIENCYATGVLEITGTDRGGFCGYDDGTITDCFWDTESSGEATSDGGTGKTTAEMKVVTTFPTWDFGTIWLIVPACNDGYPCLINVTPSCVLAPVVNKHFLMWKYRDINDIILTRDVIADVAPSLPSEVTTVVTVMQYNFGYRIPFVCLNPDGSVYGAYYYDVVEHDFDIVGTFSAVLERRIDTVSRLAWGPITIIVEPSLPHT